MGTETAAPLLPARPRDTREAAPYPASCGSLLQTVMRRKTVEQIRAELAAEEGEEADEAHGTLSVQKDEVGKPVKLARVLGIFDLLAYGVGSTVGAGVFVITGVAAKDTAGPALVLSFVVAAVACLFSGLCYCEFSTRVPVAGSAYTYAYATLGELIGFLIGWNLTLEYGISASAVARGWAGYFQAAFESFGLGLPTWLTALDLGFVTASPLSVTVVFVCTLLSCFGVKDSARFNMVMTVFNMLILVFVIVCGSFYVKVRNWHPFTPFGVSGVFSGAAKVFFSYIGFDTVSGLAAEVRNPQRDLPIGIAGTLGISGALYVGVCLVVTGMVPVWELDDDAPLSRAFTSHGLAWAADIVAVGSVTTLTANTLCSLVGQPRIFLRMARDGLFFRPFGELHPRFKTPIVGTVWTGGVAAVLAFLLDVDTLADMISIGTLLAFNVVCAGVLVVRYDLPANNHRGYHMTASIVVGSLWVGLLYKVGGPLVDYGVFALLLIAAPTAALYLMPASPSDAPFVTPFVPLTPVAGICFNTYLLYQLEASALYRLVVWTVIGLAIYFGYGIRHSSMSKLESEGDGGLRSPADSVILDGDAVNITDVDTDEEVDYVSGTAAEDVD